VWLRTLIALGNTKLLSHETQIAVNVVRLTSERLSGEQD
jgi:hypothetical protein